MKPKLLYLMHVPWGWIKQRPHFLAEKLSMYFDITLFDLEGLRNRKLYRNSQPAEGDIKISPLYLSGHLHNYSRKSKLLTWIYGKLFSAQIPDFHSYKYIWITNVLFYKYIEPLISPEQVLIFDCMDDDLEFPKIKMNPELADYYLKIESKLVTRANYIIFSAQYLSDKVFGRSPYDRQKSIIINNAIEIPSVPNTQSSNLPVAIQETLKIIDNNHPNLVYIGTISKWFDFDIIESLSKTCPSVKWILFGPNEVEIPNSPNIIHLGSIPHKYVFSIMEKADALVMPFKITELIKSVNPVKLYEYIFSGKPVIAPLYGESLQFKKYVYLYKAETEVIELCHKLKNGSLISKAPYEEGVEFVSSSTWNNRIDDILKFIL